MSLAFAGKAEASARSLEGGGPVSDATPDGDRAHHRDAADERFRLMVEASHDPFIATDAAGIITEWNPAAEAHFGWKRADAIGCSLAATLFSGADRRSFDRMSEELRNPVAKHRTIELTAQRRDGGDVQVQLTAWTTLVDGHVTFNAFVHDLSERMRFQEELRLLAVAATTDQGSGLKNRRGFFAMAEHELNVARRLGQTLTLIFFDLDRLKRINDSCGHLEGDRAIADAAQILTSSFRESDLVARLGGDEFCVLALGSEASFEQTIGRLEAALARHNETAGRPYDLSLSYGVAFFDPSQAPVSLDDLISAADASMYERKLGRDRPA